jgi:hypothetical protein
MGLAFAPPDSELLELGFLPFGTGGTGGAVSRFFGLCFLPNDLRDTMERVFFLVSVR